MRAPPSCPTLLDAIGRVLVYRIRTRLVPRWSPRNVLMRHLTGERKMALTEGSFPGDDVWDPSLHCTWCVGPALRSARRCNSLEEGDDGVREDVIPITGNHMGGVGHVHILGVRALLEEKLGTRLT